MVVGRLGGAHGQGGLQGHGGLQVSGILLKPTGTKYPYSDLIRGLSGLRLSEFVQISEFFGIYITDICQTSESFAKSVNLK